MLTIIHFLHKKRLWNSILAVIYYALVVLPHEIVGRFLSQKLDEPLGRASYNTLILVLGTVGMTGYLWLNKVGVDKYPERTETVIKYLLITFLLSILAINILMVVNVEMIHFVQYAIMAILLFPLFLDFKISLFFAIVLGMLDEAYQYWVLSPFATGYFDFNDVIINLLGAAFGLIVLFANGATTRQQIRRWHQSPVLVFTSLFILILVCFYLLGILTIYPSTDIIQAPILLVKKIPTSFWTIELPDIKFHVLQPFLGVVITVLLVGFYGQLNHESFNKGKEKSTVVGQINLRNVF